MFNIIFTFISQCVNKINKFNIHNFNVACRSVHMHFFGLSSYFVLKLLLTIFKALILIYHLAIRAASEQINIYIYIIYTNVMWMCFWLPLDLIGHIKNTLMSISTYFASVIWCISERNGLFSLEKCTGLHYIHQGLIKHCFISEWTKTEYQV